MALAKDASASLARVTPALKLMQEPDLVLAGEMRGLKTISMALTAAEKGTIVFGTDPHEQRLQDCGRHHLVEGGKPTPVPTPTPDANVAGNYKLTLTASAACEALLPMEARVTEYTATLTQSGTAVSFNAVGQVGSMPLNGSTGTVSGNMISLLVSFAETRDRPVYIYQVTATGSGQVQGSAISATLNGLIQYVGPGYNGAMCSATDHRLQFVRQ